MDSFHQKRGNKFLSPLTLQQLRDGGDQVKFKSRANHVPFLAARAYFTS